MKLLRTMLTRMIHNRNARSHTWSRRYRFKDMRTHPRVALMLVEDRIQHLIAHYLGYWIGDYP